MPDNDMRAQFHGAVKNARRELLDLLQGAYGDTDQWQFVRNRVLRIFGREGLEGMVNAGSTDEPSKSTGTGYDRRREEQNKES